ncbi:hypothetical protein O9H85_01195 [Paenibacillus filicis]|uniref:Heparinase II/III-like protein n=1 Tax=Paenibacillus gyeongsangnamensis TaxID=3388067 RepID=A0ABT4Q2P4_9BACL|nr:hypothetical protein [Paenibacillus filicis]MCZ8511071.1 hypothetical protein [Paenibacillus filicis]
MEPTYRKLVQLYDDVTESTLIKQVRDTESKYVGGIMDATGIPRPNHGGTPSAMACWASALVNPDSRYYHDPGLLDAFERAADFMLNRQHPDGTVSLGSTNFNSPPDTAFVVGGVTQMYRLLEGHDWDPVKPAAAKLKRFLERTVPAMLTGGCHTPNHRWVITAALSLLYEIFGLPELVARAEEWLAEGLDITEDGEWTERSNGIYNAVSDIALYHAGRVLNRPELLEAVRRNLRMMVYLVHPSGEVVTDYSGRQDFGHTYDMATYFLSYRFMAAHDRDPLFAAMADYAGSFIKGLEGVNNNAMLQLLVYPRETDISGLERAPLPDRYVKRINAAHPIGEHLGRIDSVGHHMKIQHSSMHLAFGAPVVRLREADTSVTIMARTPSFFSLRHGKVRLLGVKLSTSFSPGVVKFEDLVMEDGRYELGVELEKGYTGPLPKQHLPERAGAGRPSPWYLLPHQHRPMTHVQTHRLTAELTPGEAEWSIRIRSDEREDVITQLTFILGAEGTLSGDGLRPAGEEGRYVLKQGAARYEAGENAIEISPGAEEHFVSEVREDTHPQGCQYVHINLVTPFDRTFTVRLL